MQQVDFKAMQHSNLEPKGNILGNKIWSLWFCIVGQHIFTTSSLSSLLSKWYWVLFPSLLSHNRLFTNLWFNCWCFGKLPVTLLVQFYTFQKRWTSPSLWDSHFYYVYIYWLPIFASSYILGSLPTDGINISLFFSWQ